jgi:hypothetical protein
MNEPPRLPEFLERIVLAAQATSPTVRLVGGAGLALLLRHRQSDDLDLFCSLREDIEPVVLSLEDAASSLGVSVTRVRAGPGFVRLEIPTELGVLRVDVAADASPRLVAEDTYVGPIRVESLRDQRANKLIALLGRSELRDLVDLYFIERAGLPILEGFDDAVSKDGGMDPAWFAWAVAQIQLKPLRGMIAPLEQDDLRRFQDDLQRGALDRAGADQSSK